MLHAQIQALIAQLSNALRMLYECGRYNRADQIHEFNPETYREIESDIRRVRQGLEALALQGSPEQQKAAKRCTSCGAEHQKMPFRCVCPRCNGTVRSPAETTEETRVDETIKVVNKLVNGYDAAFWNESYNLVRDAVIEHLGEFCHDDDVAEEAIIIAAIEAAGKQLRRTEPGSTPTLPTQDAWHPIDTADQEAILLLWTPRCRLTDVPEHVDPHTKAEMRIARPRDWTWATHWKPLPNPPSREQEQEHEQGEGDE